MALRRTLILLTAAVALCLARDPFWNLGTVVDSSSLRRSAELKVPVYAPSGLPVPDVPGVQMMAIQSSQLAIIGQKTAYIVDKSGDSEERAVLTIHPRAKTPCELTPGRQVMYYNQDKRLHVLDENGALCRVAIVGQEALHPEK